VYGVDRDETKIASILRPVRLSTSRDWEEAVRETVAAGRLTAGTELGGPGGIGYCADLRGHAFGPQRKPLRGTIGARVRRDSPASDGADPSLILAVRSTVFPGTTEELTGALLAENPRLSAVSNPEFLREGVAMRDFMDPSLVVVGGSDPQAVRQVAAIYSPLAWNRAWSRCARRK